MAYLVDTACSGGNFKQFECSNHDSYCIKPICAGNRCVPDTWRNDGDRDCSDGSDEGMSSLGYNQGSNYTLNHVLIIISKVSLYILVTDCLEYAKNCKDHKLYDHAILKNSSFECSQECLGDTRCHFWHYYVKQKGCYMYETCNDKNHMNPGNVLGAKKCPGGK